ncbi:hypothetical protein ACLOJK_029913 [Asimina triloba]
MQSIVGTKKIVSRLEGDANIERNPSYLSRLQPCTYDGCRGGREPSFSKDRRRRRRGPTVDCWRLVERAGEAEAESELECSIRGGLKGGTWMLENLGSVGIVDEPTRSHIAMEHVFLCGANDESGHVT